MSKAHVEIALNAMGCGSVLVDGVNLANYTGSLSFAAGGGNLPVLTLNLIAEKTALTADAEVVIPAELHTALVKLGWQPPADEGGQ